MRACPPVGPILRTGHEFRPVGAPLRRDRRRDDPVPRQLAAKGWTQSTQRKTRKYAK